jgi:hypothetical protein
MLGEAVLSLFARQVRIRSGVEQDLLQVGPADERRRAEGPHPGDLGGSQGVHVRPALDEQPDGLLVAPEDREVEGGEPVRRPGIGVCRVFVEELPETGDPPERGGFVHRKLVVGRAELVGPLAVALVQRMQGFRDHGPSMKEGRPMTPRRSAMRSEPGRKPLNGWSGRGLTVAHRPRALVLIFVAAVIVGGCGGGSKHETAPVPTPIGRGPAFMPPPVGPLPPPGENCMPGALRGETRIHLELFARRRVVVIPENIGVRPRCRYPLRTLAPTGVVQVDGDGRTLRDFFAVWRMPLSRHRLLSFRGNVTAFVAGKRWTGGVGAIPLTDHAQIVVEVGGYIRPHSFYLFAPR